MPRYDSHTKRLVRERMKRTGERYTTARAAIISSSVATQHIAWEPLMATLPIGDLSCCGVEQP